MSDVAIKIENVKKEYRLGTIGGGTLSADIESWWARKRGKEDPNIKIGIDQSRIGETFYALDGINLEVKKGEVLGIIGANGAGKSTLLKLVSRVTAPTEGKIGINGRITSMLEVGTGFHPELTGRENIYMNGAILGMTKKEIDSKIEEIIDFSECRQFIDTPVKRYSSGMRVKLGFSVAAHLESEIMIMDEVLAVGDMKFQEKCLGAMGDAADGAGKTILYVSHNMATIRQLCTRCIVLKQGQIIFDGDVDRAIEIYMDNVEITSTTVDFSDRKRTDQENGQILLQRLYIKDRDSTKYMFGEKMRFSLVARGKRDIEGFSIRTTIFYADKTPVSTLYTDNVFNVKEGEEKEINLCSDISSLAPGKYYMDIIVWKYNDKVSHTRFDCVKQAVFFSVEADRNFNNGFDWGHRSYGHVVLPQLIIE